ncbi:hypothetical protein K443DRAFT_8384 [Laccaria amethystina LaAM-08-1]|uniref:Uncharacterized protein n=1 Tax=Laccaria amethystina LaAM-08-1 TaxID=1095629 RepID=A0A0C9X2W3_9AGAR|nr:hypothetical protein K443DRAFT_8384 [Laccaria amethystina LaAM-08-1]
MKSSTNNGKIAVNVKAAKGKAFIIHVKPNNIASPSNNTKSEFTGLASDSVESIIPNSIEEIEWSGWLELEEEPKTTVDWTTHTKEVNITAISEILPIQSNNRTPISLDDLPFYVNTRATIHISPKQSDFLMLRPIAAHSVKVVGTCQIKDRTRRVSYSTRHPIYPKHNSAPYLG